MKHGKQSKLRYHSNKILKFKIIIDFILFFNKNLKLLINYLLDNHISRQLG